MCACRLMWAELATGLVALVHKWVVAWKLRQGNWDSSASIVTSLQSEWKRFFAYPKCADCFWGPPSLLFSGYRGGVWGTKPPMWGADHSPPSSASVVTLATCIQKVTSSNLGQDTSCHFSWFSQAHTHASSPLLSTYFPSPQLFYDPCYAVCVAGNIVT